MLPVLQKRERKRIDNPVKIRNGTATVSAETLHTDESLPLEFSSEKAVRGPAMRKSGDLLENRLISSRVRENRQAFLHENGCGS